MPRIPGVNHLDAVRALEKAGFRVATREVMSDLSFPNGWDEARVGRVLQHYEEQSAEEAVAEHEAAFEPPTHTAMEVLDKSRESLQY